MPRRAPPLDFRQFYDRFDAPVTPIDCGDKCAPHNLNGKPFCCDICQAIPAAYEQEWRYLAGQTDLWHIWRGDECREHPEIPANFLSEMPKNMLLLACLGPAHCQREFRAVSCRQFPFLPYITSDFRFLGLAYEWEFEDSCWVINHLDQVSAEFRQGFVAAFDDLFSLWIDEMDHYAARCEQMRAHFARSRRRIPLLHRNGGFYLISPASERLQRVTPARLPKFGVYR